ncbi:MULTISPECIES: hypothetical protein [unclassified Streptomyces]|uniref:hypothetical protein n=1 Tax=unclassified Streptomyces TaxID=2593676 RepID=UPI0036E38D8A
MRTFTRSASTAIVVAALAGGATVATAGPAAAASYHCTSSSKSIDDPSYSGPWADNWDVTVTMCAKRSGSTVYSYAKVSWDGPVYASADDTAKFEDAYFKVQIKKSQSGTDPVKKSANYGGIEAKLENSDSTGNYNGSYTTPTLSYRIGSSKGLGDGELHLNWSNDGKGDRTYQFTASPVV